MSRGTARPRGRTKKCTRVAGRAFPDGESLGRNRVISSVLASGIQYVHDVLIALKRVNVEGHIDVDRYVGSAFEVAKKWWAEK